MAKKHVEQEHENLERWLLTYSDMITLLMLFFIILYSMSSLDAKKYNDLSQALETIFAGGRPEIFSSDSMSTGEGIMNNLSQFPLVRSKSGKLEDMIKQTTSILQPVLADRNVRVSINETGVVINIAAEAYFASGSSDLSPEFLPVIELVAKAISSISNEIRIEGYTDELAVVKSDNEIELGSQQYFSNWELSAQRALTVLHYLEDFGIAPERLSATGHGSTHNLENNESPEARSYNRRVDITIVMDSDD